MAHFTWPDIAAFVIYLLASVAIGSYFARGQTDLGEYLLAGRSMGRIVLSMTILAALFSGISFLLGLLIRRATARGALLGWLAGIGVLLPVCFATSVSFLWYAMIGCLTTMAVGWLLSLAEPAPKPTQLDGLTWGRGRSTVEPAERLARTAAPATTHGCAKPSFR
jgi:Na+/proline symporter